MNFSSLHLVSRLFAFRKLAPALALLLALAARNAPAAGKVFNVLNFGAAGDGVTLDTSAIQRTIDAAADDGGQVLIPRGHKFLVATLDLKGGIDFYLEGELVISTNHSDYASDGVITASNAADLRITGSGRISGQSLSFMTSYETNNEWWLFKEWRPKMFVLTGCTNLVVRDITFRDAPYWGLHMLGCKDVLVDNVTVNNRLDVPNDDGIDPDHCRDVEIRNCHLTCGDDAIVIKTTRQTKDFGPCANVHVHDCVIRTQDAGLKIGTETTGDIHDILFERCKIISGSRGLCIQLRDEGTVSNVTFRDIQFTSRYFSYPWWGRGEAISFTAIPRLPTTKLGKISDIKIQDVTGRAENSIRINGTPDSRIQNVRLENVRVKLDRWTKYPGGFYDNRPTKVLETIETHDTPGFNIRYTDDVTLEGCSIIWGRNLPDYFSQRARSRKCDRLELTWFKGKAAHPDRAPAILIH